LAEGADDEPNVPELDTVFLPVADDFDIERFGTGVVIRPGLFDRLRNGFRRGGGCEEEKGD
jgi:hypothetical protein